MIFLTAEAQTLGAYHLWQYQYVHDPWRASMWQCMVSLFTRFAADCNKMNQGKMELENKPIHYPLFGCMRGKVSRFFEVWFYNVLLALILLTPSLLRAQFTVSTNNGAITITGFTGTGGDMSIPAAIYGMPVTEIGDFAFWQNANVIRVTLPDSVRRIGHQAFMYCSSLIDVTMGNSISNIGQMAFAACTSLPTIAIPPSVTIMGDYPFAGCLSLAGIVVDPLNPAYRSTDGVLFNNGGTILIQYPGGRMGSYAVPPGITDILDLAFSGCTNLNEVTLPNTLVNIGTDSFAGCTGIKSLTLPDSPLNIGWTAFWKCTGMTNLILGNGVTSIGPYAFQDCFNIQEVAFPDSLVYLAERAFLTCTSLRRVSIPGRLQIVADFAFAQCTSLTNVTIGEGIGTIGKGAFGWCDSLTTITIPRSVTNVSTFAFVACSLLQSANFQGDAPAIDPDAFFASNLTIYYLPGTSGWTSSVNGLPAVLWNPTPQTGGSNFSVKTNGFGLQITGTAEIPIVIEAATSLSGSSWTPLKTCTLTNGSIYFADSNWTNYPTRFYRIRSP